MKPIRLVTPLPPSGDKAKSMKTFDFLVNIKSLLKISNTNTNIRIKTFNFTNSQVCPIILSQVQNGPVLSNF